LVVHPANLPFGFRLFIPRALARLSRPVKRNAIRTGGCLRPNLRYNRVMNDTAAAIADPAAAAFPDELHEVLEYAF
jgi:hypothetical protein